jgi:cytochrome c peroxidase
VELGKKLYFDPRLSKSGFISCNSCHNLSMGGTDNIPPSIGDKWQQGPINAPTVLNSSLNVAQFWDGRAADLKAGGRPDRQPGRDGLQPHPGHRHPGVHSRLRARIQAGLRQGQDRHRPGHRWPSPSSRRPWSRPTRASTSGCWARADALTADELAGYKLFKDQRLRGLPQRPGRGRQFVPEDGHRAALQGHQPAEGRSAVTGKDADRFSFKVPTLRNVELTYPYFHDGAANTLTEAVDVMGRMQLGKNFTEGRERQDRGLPEDPDRRPAAPS